MATSTAAGEAALQPAIYGPLLAALADHRHAPKTLLDLTAALPALAEPQVLEALTVLVHTGAVAPCQTESAARQAQKRCDALNRHLMGRAQSAGDIDVLASPVLGGGVSVGRFQQLFLLARAHGRKQPQEWAAYVWPILQAQGQRILKDGKPLASAEDHLAELHRQATEFADKTLPCLQAVGVA